MDLLLKYQNNKTQQQNDNIKARAGCGLALSARERAKYILFLASTSEAINFLKSEVKTK